MIYVACYDIVDQRIRQRTADLLERVGTRVQKSVFFVKMESYQIEELKKKLYKITGRRGEVLLIPLCSHCATRITILGSKETPYLSC